VADTIADDAGRECAAWTILAYSDMNVDRAVGHNAIEMARSCWSSGIVLSVVLSCAQSVFVTAGPAGCWGWGKSKII